MFKFSEDVPQIINPSLPHLACLFLVDTSGAMAGEQINDTLKALNTFRDEVKKNKPLCDVLDVAVVEFNSSAYVIQEFVPVEYMEPIYLTALGVSDMNSGLRTAVDMVLERSRIYRRMGTSSYVPWIMLITDDGWPVTPIADIADEIKDLEIKNKLRLCLVGTKVSRLEYILNLGLSRRACLLEDEHFFTRLIEQLMKPHNYYPPGEHAVELPPIENDDDWF